MKKMVWVAVALCAAAAFAVRLGPKPVVTAGWTEDLAEAKKVSLAQKKPMLLNFTGSDWCYWCKLMDSRVFAEKAWTDWAATNVVCVKIDFPRNPSPATAAYRERNEKLAEEYGVHGFPTFVILAPGGTRKIGQTQCPGRNVTPALFIEAVRKVLATADGQ